MYENMEQIRDANKATGDDFFDPDRMRKLWTWIGDDVINGNMFITSENQSLASPRLFTIRRVFTSGLIEIVGKFQQYEFYSDARDAARRLGGGAGEGPVPGIPLNELAERDGLCGCKSEHLGPDGYGCKLNKSGVAAAIEEDNHG